MLALVKGEEPDPEVVTFDDFWILYPRREAKKDAMKAWSQMTDEQQTAACVAMMDWRHVFMARESTSFIPLPASWLRGERWTDEVPREFRRGERAVAECEEFALKMQKATAERTPMPEKLRQMLAQMRLKK